MNVFVQFFMHIYIYISLVVETAYWLMLLSNRWSQSIELLSIQNLDFLTGVNHLNPWTSPRIRPLW